MTAFFIILGSIALLFALYLFLIYPGKRREGIMKDFDGKFIAHRGLFDNKAGIAENSVPAFARAVEGGYPIELDVQLTRDGKLVVFHDETLKRMCKVNKKIRECTYKELLGYGLLGGEERIPLFSQVLRLVDGKVPLLIEIKYYGDIKNTVLSLAEHMKGYTGAYAIQSFHPKAVYLYRRLCPNVARGVLSTDYNEKKDKRPFMRRFILSSLLLNFYARPDFISYEHKYADQLSYTVMRRLWKRDNACWTIRDEGSLKAAKKIFNIFIFDSFIPSNHK